MKPAIKEGQVWITQDRTKAKVLVIEYKSYRKDTWFCETFSPHGWRTLKEESIHKFYDYPEVLPPDVPYNVTSQTGQYYSVPIVVVPVGGSVPSPETQDEEGGWEDIAAEDDDQLMRELEEESRNATP